MPKIRHWFEFGGSLRLVLEVVYNTWCMAETCRDHMSSSVALITEKHRATPFYQSEHSM